MNERIYDKEVAPRLMDVAKICRTYGIPFLAIAEWAPGKIGKTELVTADECVGMGMIRDYVGEIRKLITGGPEDGKEEQNQHL